MSKLPKPVRILFATTIRLLAIDSAAIYPADLDQLMSLTALLNVVNSHPSVDLADARRWMSGGRIGPPSNLIEFQLGGIRVFSVDSRR